MKKLSLLLLIAITSTCFAQQDTTLVYSSPMYTKDPVRSKWRPVIKRVGEFYQVAFYDRKDVLQETISFEDKDLTIRRGPYLGYQHGTLKNKGLYDKGHKHGEWVTLTASGEINKNETYVYGKRDGKYTEYWDVSQVKEEGTYSNDKKSGNWKLMYKDGKVAGEEAYEMGEKRGGAYYDKNGNAAKYEDLFSPPTYKGGLQAFYRYLANEIKYPQAAARKRIMGTVKTTFTINKSGQVEELVVLESPDQDLSDEATRVIEKATWIPGKQFGETVRVKYNLPIKFSLPR